MRFSKKSKPLKSCACGPTTNDLHHGTGLPGLILEARLDSQRFWRNGEESQPSRSVVVWPDPQGLNPSVHPLLKPGRKSFQPRGQFVPVEVIPIDIAIEIKAEGVPFEMQIRGIEKGFFCLSHLHSVLQSKSEHQVFLDADMLNGALGALVTATFANFDAL